jgi:LysR family transcriptional regulator, low CO2-responsive transcriptional regulator
MSVLNLDVHQLIVFNQVAKEESISIAADNLCLTQPTVSYHLKSLERYAGVKLFYIKKQRIFLTKAGQQLYEYTRGIWSELDNIDRYLNSLKKKPIRIGVTPLLHNQVAAALSKVCKLHPETNIEIISAISNKIIQDVAGSEIDVGIVMSKNYDNDKVKSVRISNDQKLVFVVSPNVPIAHQKQVDWPDLANYPIICGQPGSLLDELVTERFRKAGIPTRPQIMLNTLSLDALKIFVKEGNSIGLWHRKDVMEEVLSGELKILPLSEDIRVPVDFIVNQDDNFLQPIIKVFREYIKQELSQNSEVDFHH